jgi:hypothetical protein
MKCHKNVVPPDFRGCKTILTKQNFILALQSNFLKKEKNWLVGTCVLNSDTRV